jgi:peptide/nickel transport system substrate-binding protein
MKQRPTRVFPGWMALKSFTALKTFSVFVILALVLAACAAPADGPATTADPPPAVADTDVDADEPADVAADEEEEDDQAVVRTVVEGSRAAQAGEMLGVTVVSDEDVTTPRDSSLWGGQYRSVTTSDGVSFHPYLTTDTASSGLQGMVYAGSLLRLDENTLEYIPNMAEAYTISDDGLTFTFTLRDDLYWSDGEPITAYDYKWTYDQVTNPDNGYPYLSQLRFITSYEALDERTLEIQIDEIYAPALGQMSGLIRPLPQHVWEDLDWSDPAENPEINSPSVVSGPYQLAEWRRDQYVLFEANELYWYHGRPNFDEYLREVVPDQDIAYQRLRTGESDTGTITPENLEEARQLDNITVYEWWPAAASWSYIGLNMREGYPTHDLNVRRGLNYALDKELITEEVMLGQARRLCSVFPETSWVYNPDVECYAYEVDQAIAEFEAAGYTFDGSQMVDADGNQLSLRLIFGPNTSRTRELMAVITQDFLSEIGIDVTIQGMEWGAFLDATDAAEPDWDMFIGGWSATIEPHIMYTIWAEDSIPELNSVAYINKEVEELFRQGGATYDTELRRELYGEVQRIIAEEAPYIFLFYQKAWSGQNNRIQGIEPTALGIGWNSEDWYIQATPE